MLTSREAVASHPGICWKPLLSCAKKYGKFSWRVLKGAVGLLLFFSFLLVYYSLIARQSQWTFPDSPIVPFEKILVQESRDSTTGGNEMTTISDVLFGIGGSAKTWPERRRYSELWWEPGTMRGYVWLDEPPAQDVAWTGSGPPHRVSEDASRFGAKAATRLARVLVESVRLKVAGVRWYVMGDDDTVFFRDNLVAVLCKYDHETMYYVGGVSESVEQEVMHSYNMAFGGGGFAISRALAETLVPIFDACLLRYDSFYGSDERVAACIAELGVPLTREPGFHQLDIRGDAYGLLAAHPVAPLVTLHHLDYLKPLFPSSATQVDALGKLFIASRADPCRTLQQSFGYEPLRRWSVSVSWGYTAQIYPWILAAHELSTAMQTFLTWRSWRPEPFTFQTRPWSSDSCSQPLIYFLDRVEEIRAGRATLSFYKRYGDSPGSDCNQTKYAEALRVKRVKVLAPKMATNEWKKAPRRYCMQMDQTIRRGSLRVRIQMCKTGESVSPPL